MKVLLSAVSAAAALALGATQAHAGALAASNFNVTSLFLANADGTPSIQNANITVLSEERRGTANSSFNGTPGTGAGAGDITIVGIGATVDVKHRCAGPDCGSIGALYGGTIENNTTTNLAVPPTKNFSLGDMLIEGSAIGGAITGLTRADASAATPPATGGAGATILNSATLQSTFTVGSTFTAAVGVTVDAHLRTWVDLMGLSSASASAGFGWNARVQCVANATSNCTGFTTLNFIPDELNQSNTTINEAGNFLLEIDPTTVFLSQTRTFRGGNTYVLTINQSSNAQVNIQPEQRVPEPATLSLIGLSLLGLAGASVRRRRIGRTGV
jgi:hypothetical protein